jgi:hypothetical protein
MSLKQLIPEPTTTSKKNIHGLENLELKIHWTSSERWA